MDYKQFKEECKQACHERHACHDGYQMLLRSNSVEEILSTVVRNWSDVWKSKYSDIVAKNITRWFDGLENNFHRAGIYVNEPARNGIAIVSNPGKVLHFEGTTRVYIFSKAHVIATDTVQVYCRDKNSEVSLFDDAYGKIEAGRVFVHDAAEAETHQECTCYDRTTIHAMGGVLYDYGHRRLSATEDVEIIKKK